eukprot:5434962-Pleurochrysis_carterae.AAC.1
MTPADEVTESRWASQLMYARSTVWVALCNPVDPHACDKLASAAYELALELARDLHHDIRHNII